MKSSETAKCDPGWNDPPLFSYESQNAQLRASKPRTLLNKRVAFPLHKESLPSSSNPLPMDPTAPLPPFTITSLPPPQAVPPREPFSLDSKCESSVEVFDPTKALENVMDILCNELNSRFENEHKDKTDIERRLDSMQKMWIDGKLCGDVQEKLLQLSEALKQGDVDKADDLQKCLMVDHGPVCSLWMSGIRHLIHKQTATTDG